MRRTTILQLDDVSGQPRVKLDLPVPLRVGDRVRLRFRVRRQNGGRTEVLDVEGEFRVSSVNLTAEHQILSVDTAVGKVPTWRAVKKDIPFERQIPPARFPPTVP